MDILTLWKLSLPALVAMPLISTLVMHYIALHSETWLTRGWGAASRMKDRQAEGGRMGGRDGGKKWTSVSRELRCPLRENLKKEAEGSSGSYVKLTWEAHITTLVKSGPPQSQWSLVVVLHQFNHRKTQGCELSRQGRGRGKVMPEWCLQLYNEDAFISYSTSMRPEYYRKWNQTTALALITLWQENSAMKELKDLSDVVEGNKNQLKNMNVLLWHVKAEGGKSIVLKVHMFKYITEKYFITFLVQYWRVLCRLKPELQCVGCSGIIMGTTQARVMRAPQKASRSNKGF